MNSLTRTQGGHTKQFDELETADKWEVLYGYALKVYECLSCDERYIGELWKLIESCSRDCGELIVSGDKDWSWLLREAAQKLEPESEWWVRWLILNKVYVLWYALLAPGEEGVR